MHFRQERFDDSPEREADMLHLRSFAAFLNDVDQARHG